MKKLTDCLGEVDFSSGDLSAVIIRKDPRELNQQDLKKKTQEAGTFLPPEG